jgi:hypothetical protein
MGHDHPNKPANGEAQDRQGSAQGDKAILNSGRGPRSGEGGQQ